tara:strand:- start:1567 stop:1773 length:207 start_codon:yes stop_codon:yes gene_type:complete
VKIEIKTINITLKYFANTIFKIEIGLVINNSKVPEKYSSEKALMHRAGMKKRNNNGDTTKSMSKFAYP